MTIRMRALRLPLLLAVLLLGAGCDRIAADFSLAWSIYREFDAPSVQISVNDRYLMVVFPSSPLADRPEVERRAHALRVAEYVRDHYPRYGALNDVSVAYFRDDHDPPGHQALVGRYTFTGADLGMPAEDAQ